MLISVQKSQEYLCNFADGGDNFTVLKDGMNRETGPDDLQALVDYVKTLPQPTQL